MTDPADIRLHRPCAPADVRRIRQSFGASRSLFALYLGVSPRTVRTWETGLRPVPRIAGRFLDELTAFPEMWHRRIKITTSTPAPPDPERS